MTKRTLWDFFRNRPLLTLSGLTHFALPLAVSAVQYAAGGMIIPMAAGDFILLYGAFGSLAWAVSAFLSPQRGVAPCSNSPQTPLLRVLGSVSQSTRVFAGSSFRIFLHRNLDDLYRFADLVPLTDPCRFDRASFDLFIWGVAKDVCGNKIKGFLRENADASPRFH